jgi:hypothetical protein
VGTLGRVLFADPENQYYLNLFSLGKGRRKMFSGACPKMLKIFGKILSHMET